MKVLKRLICWLTFHNLRVVTEYSESVRKVGCVRCGRFFGMNDRVRAFVPWDADLEQSSRLIGTPKRVNYRLRVENK